MKCRGIWLPEKYVKSLEFSSGFSYEKYLLSLARTQVRASALVCAAGCGLLHLSEYEGVVVEWCPTCHGAWFHAGSVAALLARHRRRNDGAAKSIAGHVAFDILAGVVLALFH